MPFSRIMDGPYLYGGGRWLSVSARIDGITKALGRECSGASISLADVVGRIGHPNDTDDEGQRRRQVDCLCGFQ